MPPLNLHTQSVFLEIISPNAQAGADRLFDAFGHLGRASLLEKLDLRMNHVPADSVARLVRHVRHAHALPNLKVLDLRQNLIGDEVQTCALIWHIIGARLVGPIL